jgi:hypothetical protein
LMAGVATIDQMYALSHERKHKEELKHKGA